MKQINTYIIEKLHLNKDFKMDMPKYYDKLAFPIMNEYIFEVPKFKLQHNGYSITSSGDKVFITIDFISNFENSKEIETFKEKLLDHIKKEDKSVKIEFSWDVNHNLKISFEN